MPNVWAASWTLAVPLQVARMRSGLNASCCPALLDVVGIGPDTAVALPITVGDNRERLNSEASFAALCGGSPVDRSSGRWQLRRLDRGGDRQAHAASCIGSPVRGSTRAPRTMTSAGSRRARPGAKSPDASNAARPGRSFTWSDRYSQDPAHRGCVIMDDRALQLSPGPRPTSERASHLDRAGVAKTSMGGAASMRGRPRKVQLCAWVIRSVIVRAPSNWSSHLECSIGFRCGDR
ncbi:transposase [Streptomyces alanosinicus]|uniref:transposase n=1 Tax=Streptomyces alanosinicus TaxID=68171 RepID=UPI0027E599F1|nr:transposase [Streptomyces alanosinicus]